MQIGINLFSLFFFIICRVFLKLPNQNGAYYLIFYAEFRLSHVNGSGWSRGGARGPLPSPYCWTKLRPQGPKTIFGRPFPPYLRVCMTAPPPYLKVWIRHSIVSSLDPNRPLLLIMGKWGNESLHRLSLVSKGTIATVKPADRDYSLRKHPFLLEERGETDVFAGYRDYREWWS